MSLEAKTVIVQELDALSLEYKRDYGTARENILEIVDIN